MRWIAGLVPRNVFEAIKNIFLRPFSGPPPSIELPLEVRKQLDSKFADEIKILRGLTGLALPSLTDSKLY